MTFRSLKATLVTGALLLGMALPTAAMASPVVHVGVGTSRVVHTSHVVTRPVVTTRRVWVGAHTTFDRHGHRLIVPGHFKTVEVVKQQKVVVHDTRRVPRTVYFRF